MVFIFFAVSIVFIVVSLPPTSRDRRMEKRFHFEGSELVEGVAFRFRYTNRCELYFKYSYSDASFQAMTNRLSLVRDEGVFPVRTMSNVVGPHFTSDWDVPQPNEQWKSKKVYSNILSEGEEKASISMYTDQKHIYVNAVGNRRVMLSLTDQKR